MGNTQIFITALLLIATSIAEAQCNQPGGCGARVIQAGPGVEGAPFISGQPGQQGFPGQGGFQNQIVVTTPVAGLPGFQRVCDPSGQICSFTLGGDPLDVKQDGLLTVARQGVESEAPIPAITALFKFYGDKTWRPTDGRDAICQRFLAHYTPLIQQMIAQGLLPPGFGGVGQQQQPFGPGGGPNPNPVDPTLPLPDAPIGTNPNGGGQGGNPGNGGNGNGGANPSEQPTTPESTTNPGSQIPDSAPTQDDPVHTDTNTNPESNSARRPQRRSSTNAVRRIADIGNYLLEQGTSLLNRGLDFLGQQGERLIDSWKKNPSVNVKTDCEVKKAEPTEADRNPLRVQRTCALGSVSLSAVSSAKTQQDLDNALAKKPAIETEGKFTIKTKEGIEKPIDLNVLKRSPGEKIKDVSAKSYEVSDSGGKKKTKFIELTVKITNDSPDDAREVRTLIKIGEKPEEICFVSAQSIQPYKKTLLEKGIDEKEVAAAIETVRLRENRGADTKAALLSVNSAPQCPSDKQITERATLDPDFKDLVKKKREEKPADSQKPNPPPKSDSKAAEEKKVDPAKKAEPAKAGEPAKGPEQKAKPTENVTADAGAFEYKDGEFTVTQSDGKKKRYRALVNFLDTPGGTTVPVTGVDDGMLYDFTSKGTKLGANKVVSVVQQSPEKHVEALNSLIQKQGLPYGKFEYHAEYQEGTKNYSFCTPTRCGTGTDFKSVRDAILAEKPDAKSGPIPKHNLPLFNPPKPQPAGLGLNPNGFNPHSTQDDFLKAAKNAPTELVFQMVGGTGCGPCAQFAKNQLPGLVSKHNSKVTFFEREVSRDVTEAQMNDPNGVYKVFHDHGQAITFPSFFIYKKDLSGNLTLVRAGSLQDDKNQTIDWDKTIESMKGH